MAVETGYSKIVTSGSVFIYDTGDIFNSYLGEPTTNLVPSPYAYSLYAYASGPVDTTVLNETGNTITAKRYTVTNAINTARAAIFPVTTTNTNYTFSFKWKYNGSTTATPSFTVSAAKGNPEVANNSFNSQSTTTTAIGNGWYLTVYTFNFSSNPTSGCILTFGLDTGATASYVGETYDIYQAQFELKDHKTQYVLGTRSNTQGLFDISGIGNSINLANVSFDSSAQMVFDGTNDAVDISYASAVSNALSRSWEVVVRPTANLTYAAIFGNKIGYGCTYHCNGGIYLWNSSWAFDWFDNSSYQFLSSGVAPVTNQNVHIVGTYDASDQKPRIYVNGVLRSTFGSATNMNYGGATYVIDLGYNSSGIGQYFQGYIPVAKYYQNKALSASEVLTNFNHYKTRFNIT